MSETKDNMPMLRFPEFCGEWSSKKGNEIFDSISNKEHNSDLPILAITQEYGAIPRNEIDYTVSVTDESISSYKVVEIGDFIISLRSFQGGIEYSLYKGICSPAYIILRPKIEIDRLFYKHYFKTYSYIQQLNKKLEGIRDGKMVSYKYFSEIDLPFPSPSEQQKIANFLTFIDKHIQLLKEKRDTLDSYKKGVMQKLFSQEIRFKDESGNNYSDWEEKMLGEILFEHKTRNTDNKIIEVFSVAKHQGVVNQIEHLGRSYASEDITNYKVVFPNDIVYTKSPTSDFPFGIIKQNKSERKGVVSVLYAIFTPENKNIGYLLDLYFSSSINTYNYLNPLVQKGAKNTMNISNETFLQGAKILLPTNEEEQQKIADFLSVIDAKISICEEQIKQSEEYKKGLLQQMFV